MVTALHTAEEVILYIYFFLSTAYSDIQQFYFYSMNIYYLSKYAGEKKWISRKNRNVCSLLKFDKVVLEEIKKAKKKRGGGESQKCPNIF